MLSGNKSLSERGRGKSSLGQDIKMDGSIKIIQRTKVKKKNKLEGERMSKEGRGKTE